LQVLAGRASWRRLAGVLAPIALLGLSGHSATAQTASDFATTANPLFQALLARPADINNTLQYAAGAAAAGDTESAISAYEQLLFYNPKASQTRFQLGVLYYALGSYDMARGYLETALAMPDVTPELQQKIQDLLELVAQVRRGELKPEIHGLYRLSKVRAALAELEDRRAVGKVVVVPDSVAQELGL